MFFFFVTGPKIACKSEDISETQADVLILKYANGFHGADLAVARKLGISEQEVDLKPGQHAFIESSQKIKAGEILFLGVGRLGAFDYAPIQEFAAQALSIVKRERPTAREIAVTLHGPGYGLDELACIDSLVRGLTRIDSSRVPSPADAQTIVSIVERDKRRASRILEYLANNGITPEAGADGTEVFSAKRAEAISSNGTYARRLFAAMPFAHSYLDHWELALQPAAHENDLVIERLDHEHFTGDIVSEIRTRIEKATALVAVLDENNPNVFLEVGYAWGKNKPAILLLKEGQEAPFDVRSQKLLRYDRLGQLKASLSRELKGLLGSVTS